MFQSIANARRWLLLEPAFALALVILAWSGAKNLRRNWAAAEARRSQLAAHEDFRPSQSPLLSSIGGVAADGSGLVFIVPPRGASNYALFVLHAATLQEDLGFWERVWNTLLIKGDKGLRLAGYCDGQACVHAIQAARRPEPFAVIGYTEYHTARLVLRADAARRALVLNARLQALGSVDWTSSSQPSEVASAIAKLL